jgi:hypothetical protein
MFSAGMDFEQMLRAESPACTAPELLRWTSDFLLLANKAICLIACARGLDCPPDLPRSAQRDLRVWAAYLEEHPSVAAELELASIVSWVPAPDR